MFVQHGHTVRLMAPKLVAPYRMSGKRGKNDAADAAATCDAVTRPRMRFVPSRTSINRRLFAFIALGRDLSKSAQLLTTDCGDYFLNLGGPAAKPRAIEKRDWPLSGQLAWLGKTVHE